MKKVMIVLLLMFVNVHGILKIGYASDHRVKFVDGVMLPESNNFTRNTDGEVIFYSSSVYTSMSIKMLTEDTLTLTEIMDYMHDDIVIDKVSLSTYKAKIAKHETGGLMKPYNVTNQFGYMGKYQFGNSALKTLNKVNLISFEANNTGRINFLNDSIAQEKAMTALVLYNLNYLKKKDLYKYVGKKIRGIKITAEGLLAGAHLVGPAAVSHYLKHNGSLADFYIKGKKCRKYDGNGVSIETYIKIFSQI